MVTLSQELRDLLDYWIDYARPDVTDNYGREPLITTTRDRIGKMTPTKIVYNLTRPCRIEAPCPLDRDPEECEAAAYGNASKCPESVTSHAVRRGAITHRLQSDVPTEVVLARANVGPSVLEESQTLLDAADFSRRFSPQIATVTLMIRLGVYCPGHRTRCNYSSIQ